MNSRNAKLNGKQTMETDNRNGENPSIIIYCKGWCDYLRDIVSLFHKKQWSFTFIDLRFDSKKAKDLVSELGNPLILPVLAINGTYYEKPSFSKVTGTLDLVRWRKRIDQTYYNKKTA
ncbi:MAG: hypothetical protein MK198_05540 [Gracilimonas sp.]|uniref:glutaredoxin family protein n=1 Tax=Gracilimonas sp. TaxID=1974203 RepID=UPI00375289BA|nr:hypothetical protein [Gracilimonas sp.]